MSLPKDGKYWYRSKTLWTGILGICGAVAGGLTQTIEPQTAVMTGLGSLLAIFLRTGAATPLVKK